MQKMNKRKRDRWTKHMQCMMCTYCTSLPYTYPCIGITMHSQLYIPTAYDNKAKNTKATQKQTQVKQNEEFRAK